MSPILFHDEYESILKEVIEYFDRHCVFRASPTYRVSRFHPPGKIYNSSGYTKAAYTYMMFSRRLTQNTPMLKKVSKLMLHDICETMDTINPRIQLAGLETASIPIMLGISYAAADCDIDINTFTIRKQRKAGGIFHQIEGIPNDLPVVIIDDSINNGSSKWTALAMVKRELFLDIVPNMFCLFSHHLTQINRQYKYSDLKLEMQSKSLFCKKDLNLNYSPDNYWLPKECKKVPEEIFNY